MHMKSTYSCQFKAADFCHHLPALSHRGILGWHLTERRTSSVLGPNTRTFVDQKAEVILERLQIEKGWRLDYGLCHAMEPTIRRSSMNDCAEQCWRSAGFLEGCEKAKVNYHKPITSALWQLQKYNFMNLFFFVHLQAIVNLVVWGTKIYNIGQFYHFQFSIVEYTNKKRLRNFK